MELGGLSHVDGEKESGAGQAESGLVLHHCLKVTRNPNLEPGLQVVMKVYLQKPEDRNIFCLAV